MPDSPVHNVKALYRRIGGWWRANVNIRSFTQQPCNRLPRVCWCIPEDAPKRLCLNISIVGRRLPLAFYTADKGGTSGFRAEALSFVHQFQGFVDVTLFHRLLNTIVEVGFGIAEHRFAFLAAGAAAAAGAATGAAVLPTVTGPGPEEPNSGPTSTLEVLLVFTFSFSTPSVVCLAIGSGISGAALPAPLA